MIDLPVKKLKIRKSILYLLIFVVFLAIYNFFIAEEVAYLKGVKGEIEILREQLSLMEEKKESQNPSISEQNFHSWDFISSPLLIELNQYARETQLDIIAFQQGEEKNFQGLGQKVYRLVLQGDYYKFLEWLKLLEKSQRPISLEKLKVEKLLINNKKAQIEPEESIIFLVSLHTFETKDGIGKEK